MRRLVVAMILIALALTLVACGGGGDAPAAEGDAAAPAAAPPPAAAEEDPDARPDYSPLEGQVFEPFPTNTEVTPEAILDRIEDEQSMMIYFYDDGQSLTADQTEEVDAVIIDYRDLIDLISFDLGKYTTSDQEGQITVNPEMAKDETAQQVSRLIGEQFLDIRYTPYFVFVNSDGYMTYRIRGPVDRTLLEAQVLRATE